MSVDVLQEAFWRSFNFYIGNEALCGRRRICLSHPDGVTNVTADLAEGSAPQARTARPDDVSDWNSSSAHTKLAQKEPLLRCS